MIYLNENENLNEFFRQYPQQSDREYFENLYKDYLWKFRNKKNVPLLPQELEKFVYRLGLKIENPTKKQIVLFLLNKGIN